MHMLSTQRPRADNLGCDLEGGGPESRRELTVHAEAVSKSMPAAQTVFTAPTWALPAALSEVPRRFVCPPLERVSKIRTVTEPKGLGNRVHAHSGCTQIPYRQRPSNVGRYFAEGCSLTFQAATKCPGSHMQVPSHLLDSGKRARRSQKCLANRLSGAGGNVQIVEQPVTGLNQQGGRNPMGKMRTPAEERAIVPELIVLSAKGDPATKILAVKLDMRRCCENR